MDKRLLVVLALVVLALLAGCSEPTSSYTYSASASCTGGFLCLNLASGNNNTGEGGMGWFAAGWLAAILVIVFIVIIGSAMSRKGV